MPMPDTTPRVFQVTSDGAYLKASFSFGTVIIEVPCGAFDDQVDIAIKATSVQDYLVRELYYHPYIVGMPLSIDINSSPSQPIHVSFSAPALFDCKAVHIMQAHIDGSDVAWTQHANVDSLFYTVSFQIDDSGIYGFFYNDFPLTSSAEIASLRWPQWSRVRQQPGSVVQRLENAVMLETDQLNKQSDRAASKLFLSTCPTDMLDIVYRVDLPLSIKSGFMLTFVNPADEYMLEVTDPDMLAQSLDMDLVYVNYETKVAYFSIMHEHVIVSGKMEGPEGLEILLPAKLYPEVHYVWNKLDEYGLLLGLPRLPDERNQEYKERLLSSVDYPADATMLGLVHGIAKQLGFIKMIRWTESTQPLIIYDNVMEGSIRIDGRQPTDDLVSITDGKCIIQPIASGYSDMPVVTYIQDVIHLYNLAGPDAEMFRLKWDSAGGPTAEHKKLAEHINRKAPIMWGYLRCDHAWWDPVDLQASGLACVPPISDASIMDYARLQVEH
ncbi:MAG TPA: hypothetical protein GX530_10205 [Corynebacteriales bacterium]|nr:hypothetical protein [Mycobacteriales bacterium]